MKLFAVLFCLIGCATASAGPGQSRYYLVGEITEAMVPFVAEYLAENQVAEIVISTPGGSRQASEAIADAIAKHGNVRCVVRDQAMSGGFAVLQACRVRAMSSKAQLGSHEPRMMIPIPIERTFAVQILQGLNVSSQDWNRRCRARLRMTADQYEEKVRGKDWIMGSDEALKVGAVDQVIQ